MNITTGDLDSTMILTAVDPHAAQEVPKLPTGEQRAGQGESQEPSGGMAEAREPHISSRSTITIIISVFPGSLTQRFPEVTQSINNSDDFGVTGMPALDGHIGDVELRY
jgi:hypothetical protein